jgi:hypothetical protein
VTTQESDIHRLVAAAQVSLAEIGPLHDYRAMFVRVAFAGVQAGCALALSVEHLAGAVVALVVPPEEKP